MKELLAKIAELRASLQGEKRAKFNRRVSLGDLVSDRWENARECGFGEGSSMYDNVLVLGDVRVGKNTWIGPNVVLDGSGGGLVIGDHCSIGPGVQIYTHNTVEFTTSMGKAPFAKAPTKIGDGCFIGPGSLIEMGVTIGNRVVVGAMSLVQRDLPDDSRAWGIPATVHGSR